MDNSGIPVITKAEKNDLEEILKLQYLAYQSEAALFGNKDIPPLKQTLEEVEKSDEAEDVKIQLRRIYNAKIKALQDVYDEFY